MKYSSSRIDLKIIFVDPVFYKSWFHNRSLWLWNKSVFNRLHPLLIVCGSSNCPEGSSLFLPQKHSAYFPKLSARSSPEVIISKLYSLETWATTLEGARWFSASHNCSAQWRGQRKHHPCHNARIWETMQARRKFSSEFFPIGLRALFQRVTRDTYLQWVGQMPFPPKRTGRELWRMESSSNDPG